MDTIFTVKNADFDRLSPQEAVDFFRELLWAEAAALGIGKNFINVPSAITVADGGIDAEVQNVSASGGQGIIKQGLTRYQIKTGNFSLSNESHIKSILFKDTTNELKPRVKSCLDKEGTLIIVLFGWDNPETKDDQLVNKFKEKLILIDKKYNNAKIEIWRQNNLIGFLKPFPSLTLRIRGLDRSRFQSHRSWSENDDMEKEFVAGEKQKEFISGLQTAMRQNNNEAMHIRIYGVSGIGKTRLVLEVTRADDLLPLIIYVDSANKFRDSDLMTEILREDNQFSVILVIDECDPDSRSYIWNKLKHRGPRIKIISIYNEYDDTSGNIVYFDTPQLDKEQISKIIQGYQIPKDEADRWSEKCSGSPRVAHIFGLNLKTNPEDLLKSPDTVNVWERYIVGIDDKNNPEVGQRRIVLQHIALFKRFGYERPVVSEAQAIAKIIEKADPQIIWSKFQEIIKKLKVRKILQGENTLYITPEALHIKLWIDWWDIYGNTFNLDEFSKNIPPSLLDWFNEMFVYGAESKVASQIVKELLGESGPFKDDTNLKTKLGASFFLALVEADPKSALECLNRTIGKCTKKELLEFTTGRREVVWALEKIAIWKDLFADAARLLLVLGEAENETYSNNASGIFAQLFSPAPGKVAPTEATPQERFPVLKEVLESSSKERLILGLRACDQALETQSFTRMIGAEYQGLRKEPQLWMPKTYEELFDAYRRVWQLLRERLDSLPEDEQQQGVDILLHHVWGLVRIRNLTDMVIDTINELKLKPYGDKKKILTRVIEILNYIGKELPIETRQRLEQLKDTFIGYGFSSQMKRYVGMDIFEDNYDEQGNQVNQIQIQIEALAQQAVENNNLLQSELDWLVTTEAQNGYGFGYELGKKDNGFSLLPTLLEVQRNASKNPSVSFLGGYFRIIFEKDQVRWENILDTMKEDIKLNTWIPELTKYSGTSDQAALRILDLAKKSIINIRYFWIFRVGKITQNLSEDVFKIIIEYLLSNSDIYAISTSLDMYHYYYIYKEPKHILPVKLTMKLLMHPLLFQKLNSGKRDQMDDYHWANIGKAFIKFYPGNNLEIADKILQHFGEDGTIVDNIHSRTQAVLNEITQNYSKEVWMLVTKYLGPPIDSRAYHIKQWLRGDFSFDDEEKGVLPIFPLELIFKWVDEDIENRAWYFASFLPKKLFREEGKICFAREVLVRYGTRDDVRRNLMANFSTEGWSGLESLHYQKKKQHLLEFKKEENNENVKYWIDEYVSSIDKRIEQARIEEEREGF